MAAQEVAGAAGVVGHRITRRARPSVVTDTPQSDVDADGRHAGLEVEDVGRDRGPVGLGHGYPPASLGVCSTRCGGMGELAIRVGDLPFSARWGPAPPLTQTAIPRLLPLRRRLIHFRWAGGMTGVPLGDLRPRVDYEK